MENHVGRGLSSGGFVGGQASGPLLLYDAAAPRGAGRGAAQVLSPADRFRETILGLVPASGAAGDAGALVLAAGPHGYLIDLPPGHAQAVLLVPSEAGIGAAAAAWGDALQRAHGTTRLPAAQDVWTSSLTYFTSNGAYFSNTWWREQPANVTGEAVLLALQAYHAAAGLPVRAYQLDPWWMPCGEAGTPDAGSPLDWAPRQDRFPRGFAPLAAAGMRLMLYGAYWAPPPANRLSGFDWEISQRMPDGPVAIARVAANQSRALYDALLARAAAWGGGPGSALLAGIETDWMMKNTLAFADAQTTVGALDAYWAGAADAALAAGVPWQLCLSFASDLLQALDHPAVTHVRVSIDAEPLHFPRRWRTGMSALLHGALALRPFVDVVLTASPQPGLPYAWDAGGNASYPELALLAAALSTGPVGLGDGIGLSNASLAAAACAVDGTLLQPSAPATFVDDQYALEAAGDDAGGTVFQAMSYIAAAPGQAPGAPCRTGCAVHVFATVLAVDVARPRSLAPSALSPPLPGAAAAGLPRARGLTLGVADSLAPQPTAAGGAYVAARWSDGFAVRAAACADGAPAAGCLVAVSDAAPLQLATGPGGGAAAPYEHSLELHSLAPVLPGGWVLVGELAKAVRVAPRRFEWLTATAVGAGSGGGDAGASAAASAAGVQFAVRVAAGERVNVTLLAPPSGTAGRSSSSAAAALEGTMVQVSLEGGPGSSVVVVACTAGACGVVQP